METNYDFDKLKKDLKCEFQGAYFGGGFGGALIESWEIDGANEEELIRIAKRMGFNLSRYLK